MSKLALTDAAMIPSDQVALLLKEMKEEQERLLRQQREVIVQEVVASLRDAGLVQTPLEMKPSKSTRGRAEQKPEATIRLEKNLHTLVLHSLDESGLDFPHVQQNQYDKSVPANGRPPIRDTQGRTVIVARKEGMEPQASSESDNIQTVDPSAKTSCQPQIKRELPTMIRQSPLLKTTKREKRKQRQVKPRQNRGRSRQRSSEEDEEGEDADFNSLRNKVGHKTLAILERSRALLKETRQNQGGVGGGTRGETFVDRMRKQRMLTATEGSEKDNLVEDPEESPHGSSQDVRPLSAKQGLKDPEKTDADSTSLVGEEYWVTAQEPIQESLVADIELLRPPNHAPEKENEWENELARQILTIYATSVKAKAAGITPNRTDTSHERSRPPTSSRPPKLTASYSLPAIHTKPPSQPPCQRSKAPPKGTVQYSWEPSQRLTDGKVVVNMPKIPKPIWFAGTGAVKAVWCALAQGFESLNSTSTKSSPSKKPQSVLAVCEHNLCEELRQMEAKQQYAQCITTVETLLISLVRARGVDVLETKLWKQLVVTCNAFASRCVDYKKFPVALQLMQLAEHLIHNSVLVDDTMRMELLAYLYDTYAHYYYKRRKPHAGLQYMVKAQEIHARQSSWSHVAKCQLHTANLLSFQGKHLEALASMARILELIEENKLEDEPGAHGDGASAQKICLAAVCYNNLAVEQLQLRQFQAASVSTGNAKRLAKLCLSYSNRWLAQFKATSDCVNLAIATLMEDANANKNGKCIT
ncbi:hypothetical protein Poli38472_008841 [Pythium oligandrum]|uniref:Uncharacterized protein n=1 Tax=Pythium oligandrum TaxID=41045 RepID=A0A8K1C4C5_PYTOL|nr:hypothetical protein Poli38472_008841 [Pythium oligandrum]|eukprot:TMW56193.1 hypothetical protein Poli38472_008841 [Pythium oligandrum]